MSGKDDRIVIRVSEPKKERIRKRVRGLDKSMSAHMLYCYDLEESITKGDSIVIPRSKQVSSEGKTAAEELESDPNFPF